MSYMSDNSQGYVYTDRIAKIYQYLRRCKVRDGLSKLDFITKSTMVSNILMSECTDKYTIEAGSLSYVKMYCGNDKDIPKLFGTKISKCLKEVAEIARICASGKPAELKTLENGFSLYAKNVYATKLYIDVIYLFSGPCKSTLEIDGEHLKIGKSKVTIGGDNTLKLSEVQSMTLELVQERYDSLGYVNLDLSEGLRFWVKRYAEKSGLDFIDLIKD
jgi:hypothetical protein